MIRILGLLVLLAGTAEAGEYSLKVREVTITYQKVVNKRSPLQPEIPSPDWGDHVSIKPHLTLLKRGFFDSEWYFDTAYSKVTEAGLKFDLGVRMFSWADLVYTHRSWHSADKLNSYDNPHGFGLEDYVGVRLKFVP